MGANFWRTVALPVAIFSAALCSVGWYAYTAARQMVRLNVAGDMQVITKLKSDQIQQWLADRRDDAELISTKRLSLDLQRWLKQGGRDHNIANRILEQLPSAGISHYRDISLYSPTDGGLLLSNGIRRDSSALRAQILEVGKFGHSVVEDIHFAGGNNESEILVGYLIPLLGVTGGPPLAVIHLIMDPGETLFPLLQKWPRASSSAETLLLRKEGDQVVYLNTLRHIGNSALRLRHALSTPDLVAARLGANEDGFMEGDDYRGVASLAYGVHIAGTPWFLVSKIDREEAYGQLNSITAYSSLLLVALLLVFAWWMFERSRSEGILANTFSEIEDLYQNAPCGYHSLDRDGTFVRINETELRMLGYTREEIIGKKKMQELLSAESRIKVENIFPRFLAMGEAKGLELDFVRKDGTFLSGIVSATSVRDIDGGFVQSRVTLQDLSSYKRAERQLRLNEERFRGFYESIRDAIFVHDLREDGSPGNFVEVNDVACARLGYSRDELLMMSPMDIDAPEFMPKMMPVVEHLISKKSVIFEQVHVTKDGKSIPVEISASLFLQQGQTMIVSLVRDISERKVAELELIESREQLRKLAIFDNSVREDERKRIAREVHDELGQLLTALRMDIVMLQMRFDEIPSLFEKTEEMLGLIQNTIKVVRNVTTNLRPPALDSGIIGALEWLTEDFTRRTNIRCSFDRRLPDIILEDTLATTLFRIVQESLTNVTRHAQAQNVSISLTGGADFVSLVVEDDGCGFDPHAALQARNTFGLLGMRERAKALNGELHIDSSPGNGTRVVIELPLKANEPQ